MSLGSDLKEIETILCNNEQGYAAIREILQRIRDRDIWGNQQVTIEEKIDNEHTRN
jgi:hypothetical protein